MLKNARLIIGLGALGTTVTIGLVGWLTGFFAQVVAVVSNLWQGFITWITSPFSIEHAFAALGVLIVPLIILAVMFAITDN